ncbi:thermostable hemolysin [Actinokineospora sp. 24-640]
MTIDRASAPVRASRRRFRIGFAHQGTLQYEYCVDLVRRKYREKYQAEVEPGPGLFVTAWDNTRHSPTFGRTLGVAGLTGTQDGPLLSENYLDDPVEDACAALAGWAVRGRIAEMGPLASFYPGAGMFLLRNLPRVSVHLGYDFLLSTLTDRLHDLAKDAGWDFHTLANARRDDLKGGPNDWGTYYSARPRTGILWCGQSDALSAAA